MFSEFLTIGSLVHDVFVDEDSPTSSRSDPETDCDNVIESGPGDAKAAEDERHNSQACGTVSSPWYGERRRRKLPEIPKNKKCKLVVAQCVKL